MDLSSNALSTSFDAQQQPSTFKQRQPRQSSIHQHNRNRNSNSYTSHRFSFNLNFLKDEKIKQYSIHPTRRFLLDGTHSPYNISFYSFCLGMMAGIGITLFVTSAWWRLWWSPWSSYSSSQQHSGNPLENKYLIPRGIFIEGSSGGGEVSTSMMRDLGCHFLVIAMFHWLEYIMIALYDNKDCTLSAYLIPHSREYMIAQVGCVIEYLISAIYFPGMKEIWSIKLLGLAMIIAGQTIRSMGICTAGNNFSHIVVTKKDPSHVLVQSGIFQYLRHPAYFGFYWWSIGTQLWLCNGVSFVGFLYGLRRFFKDRIPREEAWLIEFFGNEYVVYRKNSYLGIPFLE